MVLFAPATIYAQRGGRLQSRGEFRNDERGAINRVEVRRGSGFIGVPIYAPVPVLSPFYSYPTITTVPTNSMFYPLAYGPNVPSPVAVSSPPAPAPDYVQALASQIQDLTAEVERLRNVQRPQSTVAPDPLPVLPNTTLVFRDSHRVEIQSYAIIGQTLRVLDKDNSARLALSDLDLDATKKVNQDNGVRFIVPSAQ